MARPRKEGMDYFPHDVTLSADKKIEALRTLHGNDGYTFYCIMLENIFQEPTFELDVSDAETIQIFAKKVEVTTEKFNEMLKTSIKHGCFDRERYLQDGVLTSNGIKKRAEVVLKKRVAMREVHEKKVSVVVSDAETTEEMPQSKSKSKRKVKEKDIKEVKKEYADYVFLTETEYGKLTELLGEDERGRYFLRFASWISGQTERVQKSRSAYLTILTWHRDSDKQPKRNNAPRQGKLSAFERLQQMAKEEQERGAIRNH